MERGLLDTNVVIHLPRLDASVLPDEMVISAITLAELSAGPHIAQTMRSKGRSESAFFSTWRRRSTRCRSMPRQHEPSARSRRPCSPTGADVAVGSRT